MTLYVISFWLEWAIFLNHKWTQWTQVRTWAKWTNTSPKWPTSLGCRCSRSLRRSEPRSRSRGRLWRFKWWLFDIVVTYEKKKNRLENRFVQLWSNMEKWWSNMKHQMARNGPDQSVQHHSHSSFAILYLSYKCSNCFFQMDKNNKNGSIQLNSINWFTIFKLFSNKMLAIFDQKSVSWWGQNPLDPGTAPRHVARAPPRAPTNPGGRKTCPTLKAIWLVTMVMMFVQNLNSGTNLFKINAKNLLALLLITAGVCSEAVETEHGQRQFTLLWMPVSKPGGFVGKHLNQKIRPNYD